MASTTLETTHAAIGIAPVADLFNGSPATDVFSMENYGLATFILTIGVGTAGTATLTIEACDDFTPTSTQAVAFAYKRITTPDTHVALVEAAAAGFTTTAGSNQVYQLEVEAAALGSDGPNVRLKITEVDSNAILGGINVILSQPRYAHDVTVVATS